MKAKSGKFNSKRKVVIRMADRITKRDMEMVVTPMIIALNGNRVVNYTRKMYGPDGFYSWDADRGDIIYNSGTGHVAQVLHIGTDKKAYETCMVIHNYMREMGYKDELFNRGLR